jgi:hypothetical protein
VIVRHGKACEPPLAAGLEVEQEQVSRPLLPELAVEEEGPTIRHEAGLAVGLSGLAGEPARRLPGFEEPEVRCRVPGGTALGDQAAPVG